MTGTQRVQLEPGYVLHRRAYRETSLLLDVLTREHGRVGLVARGARRGRDSPAAVLQPFVPLLFTWSASGELGTLAGAESAGPRAEISGKLLFSGLYANELLVRLLPRNDPHPELFGVYATLLGSLSQRHLLESTLRRFEMQLLAELGYGLVLDRTAGEGTAIDPQRYYHYLPEHGAVPARSGDSAGVRVKGNILLAIAQDRFESEAVLSGAKRLMRCVLAHHLGNRPLASRTLFRDRARSAGS